MRNKRQLAAEAGNPHLGAEACSLYDLPAMRRQHDLLAHWHERRQINDRQFDAGRKFERLYELAGLQSHASIDVTRPKVDRSRLPIGSVDAGLDAKTELLELRATLGAFDFSLVSRVIGAGKALAGEGADTDQPSDVERKYLARRVRDALAIIAVHLSLEAA